MQQDMNESEPKLRIRRENNMNYSIFQIDSNCHNRLFYLRCLTYPSKSHSENTKEEKCTILKPNKSGNERNKESHTDICHAVK